MRTIEKTVYSIDELDERSFQKAYDSWSASQEFFDEFIIEDMMEELKNQGVEDPKIRYSGFSSQGDGASFTGRVRDVGAFLGRELNRHEKFVLEQTSVNLVANSSRYYHESTVTTDFKFGYSHTFDNQLSKLEKIACELESEINDKRLNLCHEFYRRLESEYNYQMSEDSSKEYCESNNIEFYNNGEQYT